MSLLRDIVDQVVRVPHGSYLFGMPTALTLRVLCDGLIGAAYYSIPLMLAIVARRRKDLAPRGGLWLFVLLIVASATTHWLNIWRLWYPAHGVDDMVKVIKVVAAVLSAMWLWSRLPQALTLPSPAALRQANQALEQQLRERDAAAAAMQREMAEHEQAEAILRQAQKMQAVGQLTAGVAHDFNNLLLVIAANLELLETRIKHEPTLRKYVERALQSVDRGALLTQQLLAFASRQPLNPVTFDPGMLIGAMSDILADTLGDSVELRTRLPEEVWLVEADPYQLESALLNLASNARDAMPAGGTLLLEVRNQRIEADLVLEADKIEAGDHVAMVLSDTGTGMTAEVRAAAFEPFFTTKPVGTGSGLGLSQVFGFIKQSHGHVTLESEAGRGTTISLYLPRSTAAPSPFAFAGAVGQVRAKT
jgi:signal transduction histidine kinase